MPPKSKVPESTVPVATAPNATEPSKTALAGILKLREGLAKEFGTALTRQDTQSTAYEVISTGSLALDYATVVGGVVRGRIHLFWGSEGCLKTTQAIKCMVEAQQKFPDLAVCYIDMEQTFDFDWAHHHGLDTREHRFIHLFPENSEDVADMLKKACQSGVISMAVVDSVGGMVTKKASEKDADESDMGKNAQIVTRMCQVTAVEARKNKVAVIIVSQVRAIISATGGETYAAPKALRHATSMVVKFRKSDKAIMHKVEGEDIPVGQPFAAKVERSKVAAGGRTAFMTVYNVGTDKYGPVGVDIIDEAWTVGTKPSVNAIQQRGAWYDFPDGSKHNGAEAAKAYLREHGDVLTTIWNKAIESVRSFVQEEAPELVFIAGDPEIEGESA